MNIAEVQLSILLRSSVRDLLNLAKINKTFFQICNSIYFWELKYIEEKFDPPKIIDMPLADHFLYSNTMYYIKELNNFAILLIHFNFYNA